MANHMSPPGKNQGGISPEQFGPLPRTRRESARSASQPPHCFAIDPLTFDHDHVRVVWETDLVAFELVDDEIRGSRADDVALRVQPSGRGRSIANTKPGDPDILGHTQAKFPEKPGQPLLLADDGVRPMTGEPASKSLFLPAFADQRRNAGVAWRPLLPVEEGGSVLAIVALVDAAFDQQSDPPVTEPGESTQHGVGRLELVGN